MVNKEPYIYPLKEIEDLKLNLQDVLFPHDLQDYKKSINSFYTIKDNINKKCSYCHKIRKIAVVEGIKLRSELKLANYRAENLIERGLKGISTSKKGDKMFLHTNLYHQRYYLVCKSCLTARSI